MRAADDLAGCALLAALLESLVADRRNASVEVIYTRAEEAGLLGSTVLAQSGYLSHDDPILVVETSRELPSARIGKGPVLRLGDLMSVFDPGLARLLHLAALDLARERRGFRFQRTLMDGGTCESSSYIAFGYRATGIALPLANYHNMGSKRIAAEEVSAADLVHALTLLEGLVTRPWPARGWPAAADRKPLVSLLRPAEARLRNSVTDPPHDWKDPA
jgi:endoglucanase